MNSGVNDDSFFIDFEGFLSHEDVTNLIFGLEPRKEGEVQLQRTSTTKDRSSQELVKALKRSATDVEYEDIPG